MKCSVVSSKQLGINCWSAHRFCGGRCKRVMYCTCPEKAECKAVQTEIDYLNNYYSTEIERLERQQGESLATLRGTIK